MTLALPSPDTAFGEPQKDAKKVRTKIIKLKQDIDKPDFGRS